MDDAARVANGGGAIVLPTGIGFCLYIRRACIDAVGPLSDLYTRGYYEDVEFCLRARETGFRNVCATGVFVGHAGARSFLGEKRSLVVRNLVVLEARFPEHRLECAAFLKADPLAPALAQGSRSVLYPMEPSSSSSPPRDPPILSFSNVQTQSRRPKTRSIASIANFRRCMRT